MSHSHLHANGDHTHSPAGEHPPAGGPVVLDIGGDIGALIVHLDSRLIGHELHIRDVTDRATTTHTGIWERSANGRTMVVAVFSLVPAGVYEILGTDDRPNATVSIEPGKVAEIDLRDLR